jgi:hypothetical protein
MQTILTEAVLARENVHFHGTGGRSQENREHGFVPAFMDLQTRTVYLSRFADGRPAPIHVLDGLPDEVVLSRHLSGRVASVKTSIVSGFMLEGRFFSRDEAATLAEHRRVA